MYNIQVHIGFEGRAGEVFCAETLRSFWIHIKELPVLMYGAGLSLPGSAFLWARKTSDPFLAPRRGIQGRGGPPIREGKGRLERIIKSKGTPWEGTEKETEREHYRAFKQTLIHCRTITG
jgi:hypothetical protein